MGTQLLSLFFAPLCPSLKSCPFCFGYSFVFPPSNLNFSKNPCTLLQTFETYSSPSISLRHSLKPLPPYDNFGLPLSSQGILCVPEKNFLLTVPLVPPFLHNRQSVFPLNEGSLFWHNFLHTGSLLWEHNSFLRLHG